MQTKLLLGALAGAALSLQAAAGTTYFATNGTTLYRIEEGGSFESFDIGAELNSLSFDSSGRLWGGEINDANGNQSYDLYEILDPFGSLSAVSRGDYLPGRLASLTFGGKSEMLGFDGTNAQVLGIDAFGESWSALAPSIAANTVAKSSAYDADTDTLYGIRNAKLFEYSNDGTYTATQIATLSGGETTGSAGGEWYNGQYYHVVNDGSHMSLYTVDLQSGALTELLSWRVDFQGGVGLAVANGTIVPTPGAAALLGLGGLAGLRRRR
ncbi:MAG: hypothetical protein R3B49_05035 [Phycisphaerales bacterium]